MRKIIPGEKRENLDWVKGCRLTSAVIYSTGVAARTPTSPVQAVIALSSLTWGLHLPTPHTHTLLPQDKDQPGKGGSQMQKNI